MSASAPTGFRPVWGEVDLERAAGQRPGARRRWRAPAAVLAVVKADAYGHGAVPGRAGRARRPGRPGWASRSSKRGCAPRRRASTRRILVLSEPPPAAADAVVAHDLTPVVYTSAGIEALGAAVVDAGTRRDPLPVHLKVDTGMHRVGCAPDDAVALAETIAAHPELALRGRVHAPRGRRRARSRLHGRAARALRRRARGARGAVCARPRSSTPRTRPGCSRSPTPPLRPRAARDRALRRPARAGPRRPRRAAARALAQGARLARQGAARRVRACRTGCATSSTRPSRDRDRAGRATPTASPATSGSPAARC